MVGEEEKLTIGRYQIGSRLLLGTTDIVSNKNLLETVNESGAEMVTVAIKTASEKCEDTFLNVVKKLDGARIVPNTAGAYTAEDAVELAEAGCDILSTRLVKLEVIGDRDTLLPNTSETIKAAKQLISSGIDVMAYTNDDPVVARKLYDMGCSAIMPLGSPIGSGLGILNPHNIKLIRKVVGRTVPVILDAGIGSAKDAVEAMELGCDAVLISSSVHKARKPILMAKAMRYAVEAGRFSFISGRITRTHLYAVKSSDVSY